MSEEIWGILATPPKDIVRLQAWLRARWVRKTRKALRDKRWVEGMAILAAETRKQNRFKKAA